MKRLALAISLLAVGCFGSIRVYRGLRDPTAMRTCNANKSYQAQAPGRDEPHAQQNAIRAAKDIVRRDGGCGLLVTREDYDRTNRIGVVNFQLCECR